MKPKLQVSEAQTQKAIREYLEYNKWKIHKLTIPRYSKGKGLPDLLCLKGEILLFAEIKSPTVYYKATKEQEQFFEDLRKVRHLKGGVFRSIEEVKEILGV